MSTTFASIIMSFNVTFLATTPSKTRNKLKINVYRPTTAQVSSLCSMSLPDFRQGFAALHDKTSLLIFLIKCAKRFEEFWRVRNKAVVLPPPKQFTWIEIKSNQLISRGFLEDQTAFFLRLHRTIAFRICSMNQKSKCRQYGRCYLFRLNRLARKKVVFSQ